MMLPQPTGTMTQKMKLSGARERVPKKTYVRATDYESPVFNRFYTKLKSDPSWRVPEVPCGHDVMIDMPELLAGMLEDAA